MWEELRRFGRELTGDTRVVVVAGEGRSFSAGLDLTAVSADAGPSGFSFASIAGQDEAAATRIIAGFQEAFAWLRRPDLVSIAAGGHAIYWPTRARLRPARRRGRPVTMAEVSLDWCRIWRYEALVELSVGQPGAGDRITGGAAAEADRIGWPRRKQDSSTRRQGSGRPRARRAHDA
jgi:hypothetical protein